MHHTGSHSCTTCLCKSRITGSHSPEVKVVACSGLCNSKANDSRHRNTSSAACIGGEQRLNGLMGTKAGKKATTPCRYCLGRPVRRCQGWCITPLRVPGYVYAIYCRHSFLHGDCHNHYTSPQSPEFHCQRPTGQMADWPSNQCTTLCHQDAAPPTGRGPTTPLPPKHPVQSHGVHQSRSFACMAYHLSGHCQLVPTWNVM